MNEYNNNNNEAVGEEDYNPYSDYMVSPEDSVDTAVKVMVGRIKTRLSFMEHFGASKEKLDSSRKKWVGDILTFMTDKGILSDDAKALLLGIL